MGHMKRWIVARLDDLCGLLDHVPGYWDGRWHRYGTWGCRFGIANASVDLDDHWKTGYWK